MAISKHGKRVDEILSQSPKEPDLQEQISREAARIEIEQTTAYIHDWVTRRCGRTFRGLSVTVKHDLAMAWYEAEINLLAEGTIHTARRAIREEDIANSATDTDSWSRFMDRQCDELRNTLRNKLIAAGVKTVETDRTGMTIAMNGLSSSFQTSLRSAAQSMEKMGDSLQEVGRASRDLTGRVEAIEEREAIESIKRTIEGQAE